MATRNKIKAILFDKDGVLVDFQATYGGSTIEIISRLSDGDAGVLQKLASKIGIRLKDNYVDPYSMLVAGSVAEICGVWAGVLGVQNDPEFQTQINAWYTELTRNDAVFFGNVDDVLKRVGQFYRIGLATNDTEECALAQLGQRNFHLYFDFIAGFDSGFGAKPEIGMAEAFARKININLNEIVMLGDSIEDMKFAKTAGMTAIGISTGPLPACDLSAYADHMIDSLDELQPLIEQL